MPAIGGAVSPSSCVYRMKDRVPAYKTRVPPGPHSRAAWAAERRAMGTLGPEQET